MKNFIVMLATVVAMSMFMSCGKNAPVAADPFTSDSISTDSIELVSGDSLVADSAIAVEQDASLNE